MPFIVEGYIDDFRLEATARTAKKAFAEAIEWHVAKQFSAVSIKDGSRSYCRVLGGHGAARDRRYDLSACSEGEPGNIRDDFSGTRWPCF